MARALYDEMVNENHQPSDHQEQILKNMKDGRESGGPWGYATPRSLREQTDINKNNLNFHLRQLATAGWITKVTRGFYRFETDPRENNEQPEPDQEH